MRQKLSLVVAKERNLSGFIQTILRLQYKPEKNKSSAIASYDLSSDSDNLDCAIQFSSKTSVAAPPLVPFKPQNSAIDFQIGVKCGKKGKTEVFKKSDQSEKKNTAVLASKENETSKKDVLLAKINEMKKK